MAGREARATSFGKHFMDAIDYALELVAIHSESRRSNEKISRIVAAHLERLQFQVEWLSYRDECGELKVNLIAKRGSGPGGVAYFSHTDVVPADDWALDFCGPYSPVVKDDRLWGRGSCDMKGSLACALAAAESISPSDQTAPIYIVCSADEELGTVGARQIDEQSLFFQEMVAQNVLGIIGEPTMLDVVHAHKGGYGMTISARGISAHSSMSEGVNANHQLIPILPLLLEIQKQCETDPSLHCSLFHPPTLSWNMILKNCPEAINITPSLAQACIFFRPMPGVDHMRLIDRLHKECERLGLEMQLVDKTPPLVVPIDAPAVRFMLDQCQEKSPQTVCYSTDGGVLQRIKQMVVCGPGDIAQAHRNNEWISLEQLSRGTDVYRNCFLKWYPWFRSQPEADFSMSVAPPAMETPIPLSPTKHRMEYSVRQAVPEDLAGVQAFLETFVAKRKLLRRTRSELSSLIANGFIAEREGEFIGFAAVEIYSRKLGEIQCLAVSENYQGQGIGSELVRHCVQRAREKGILEVMAISSSEGFLRQIGFDYSLPDQKRALFFQLRSRDEMFNQEE